MAMAHIIAAGDGTTLNPVTLPTRGKLDAEPVREDHADELRDPLPPASAPAVMPRQLALIDNEPPALKIPAQPNRRPRHPGGAWALFARLANNEWGQTSPGSHAQVAMAIQPPSGRQETFYRTGNTFRLPPEPADAQVFVGVVPGYDQLQRGA